MGIFDRFLGLFHRRQRFTKQYTNLSSLKKMLFFGVTGFIITLSASKFIYPDLQFYFEPTQFNRLLIKLNPALERGVYQPSLWMLLGVFQRLYAKYRQEEPYLRTRQESVEGYGVSWVELHDKAYQKSKKMQNQIPLVVVLAGSEGIDNTVKYLMLAAYNLGYRVVAIDPKDLYDTNKIDKIVNTFREKYPQSAVLGVGVEYGANLLINYAAQHPQIFQGLVSIGNPFDLLRSEITLQQSWTWSLLCTQMLKSKLQKAQPLPNPIPTSALSLFELERYLYDIKDQQYVQWKQQNSCINNITNLSVPTLFIQSKEDPFTQKVQEDQRYLNQKCIYVTTERGGHNEWFENLWMNRWVTAPVQSFLKLVHEQKIKKIVENYNQQPNPSIVS